MTSVHTQILDKVRAEIITLADVLSVFEAPEIVVRRWPWDEGQAYQGVTIWKNAIGEADGTVGADDYAYRCVVTYIAPNESQSLNQIDRFPQIEQALRKHFHEKRRITGLKLASGIQPGICKFVPEIKIDPPKKADWTTQFEWQHSLIVVHCREVRPT